MTEIVLLNGEQIAVFRSKKIVPRYAFQLLNKHVAVVYADELLNIYNDIEMRTEDAWLECWQRWAFHNALNREIVSKIFGSYNLYPKKRKQ